MKKLISLFLSFIMVFSITSIAANAFAAETQNINFNVSYHQTEARKMLALVNNFRKSNETWITQNGKKKNLIDVYHENGNYAGCTQEDIERPLAYDYDLEKLAMQRVAEYLLEQRPTRPDGSAFETVGNNYDWELRINAEKKSGTKANSASTVFSLLKDGDPFSMSGQSNYLRYYFANPLYHSMAVACINNGLTYYWVVAFSKSEPTDNGSIKTTPVDTSKSVTAKVISASVYTSYDFPYELEVKEGKKISIPQLQKTVFVGEEFSLPTTVVSNVNYSLSNKKISLNNGKIVGKKPGKTTLTLTSKTEKFDRKITCTIKINHNFKLIKNNKATTTKKGKKIYKCKCCGKKKTVYTPKLPATPTGIKASVNGNKVTVTWSKVSGADAYKIVYNNGKTKKETYSGKNSVTLNLSSGKTYKISLYSIKYYDYDVLSKKSKTITIKTK